MQSSYVLICVVKPGGQTATPEPSGTQYWNPETRGKQTSPASQVPALGGLIAVHMTTDSQVPPPSGRAVQPPSVVPTDVGTSADCAPIMHWGSLGGGMQVAAMAPPQPPPPQESFA